MMIFLMILGICLIPFLAVLPNKLKPILSFFISVIFAVVTTEWALKSFQSHSFYLFIAEVPIIGVWEFNIDILSGFFIIIVNFITVLASFYSISFLRGNTDSVALSMHFISYNILHLSMLMVCMVQNLFPFLIVWELMSISSFLLVIFQFRKENTLKAGLNYLVQMHIGVILLMIGVLILFNSTHSNDFSFLAFRDYFRSHDAAHANFWMFLLFFLGFGFKVGFIGLHTWMPAAYSAAPSHVAAVMSGVMKKLGLYGILRVLLYVEHNRLEIGLFILMVSIITGLYGIINAIMNKDMKKILTYSSMENMGIIGIGMAMGMIGFGVYDLSIAFLGFAGLLLQIINHALFKSTLFFGVGSIFKRTQTRDLDELGGLAKKMPVTSILFLISTIAVCGLPPFNGFVSEYLLYSGLLEGLNATFVTSEVFLLLALIVLSLIGGLVIYAYSKVFGLAFLGTPRSDKINNATEVDIIALIPQIISILVMISIGLFPGFYLNIIMSVVDLFVPFYSHAKDKSFFNLQQIGLTSFVFILIVGIVLGIRNFLFKRREINYGPTWGCGYQVPNSRRQYTSASFADYFAKLAKPFIGINNTFKYIPAKEIFPEPRKIHIESYDAIEKNVIDRMLDYFLLRIKKFAVIQTGQTQFYILYAFVFLIILFIITFFEII
jgi:hydrogenase-4 component B